LNLFCIQSPEAKLAQISDLAASSRGNVITLDDSTYAYYAITKPRPYTLLVFLTAAHPKFKCGVCKHLDREVQSLAEAYAAEIKLKKGTPELFFIRLDYEASQRVFQSYQTQSVPVVFHIAPNQGERDQKDYEILIRDKFQVPQEPDAEAIGSFLRERSGISIKIERGMIMTYVVLVLVFAILAALVRPVITYLPFFLRMIRTKSLWITVSAGVYTCAISGLIFDIIRTPPM
jgi:OST3 / OST6 family, transporter family